MTSKSLSETTHALRCRENTERLNREGCEFGRRDAERLNMFEADIKSELVSVRSGQKYFTEDIFPKMQEDVRDSKAYVKVATDAVVDVRKFFDKLVGGVLLAVLLMILTTGITGFLSWIKIQQDAANQKQLMEFLMKNWKEAKP